MIGAFLVIESIRGDNMNAVLNGERIECGVCGSLLCKITEFTIDNSGLTYYVNNEKDAPIKIRDKVNLEIKCKHKSQGKYCDTINTILL